MLKEIVERKKQVTEIKRQLRNVRQEKLERAEMKKRELGNTFGTPKVDSSKLSLSLALANGNSEAAPMYEAQQRIEYRQELQRVSSFDTVLVTDSLEKPLAGEPSLKLENKPDITATECQIEFTEARQNATQLVPEIHLEDLGAEVPSSATTVHDAIHDDQLDFELEEEQERFETEEIIRQHRRTVQNTPEDVEPEIEIVPENPIKPEATKESPKKEFRLSYLECFELAFQQVKGETLSSRLEEAEQKAFQLEKKVCCIDNSEVYAVSETFGMLATVEHKRKRIGLFSGESFSVTHFFQYPPKYENVKRLKFHSCDKLLTFSTECPEKVLVVFKIPESYFTEPTFTEYKLPSEYCAEFEEVAVDSNSTVYLTYKQTLFAMTGKRMFRFEFASSEIKSLRVAGSGFVTVITEDSIALLQFRPLVGISVAHTIAVTSEKLFITLGGTKLAIPSYPCQIQLTYAIVPQEVLKFTSAPLSFIPCLYLITFISSDSEPADELDVDTLPGICGYLFTIDQQSNVRVIHQLPLPTAETKYQSYRLVHQPRSPPILLYISKADTNACDIIQNSLAKSSESYS